MNSGFKHAVAAAMVLVAGWAGVACGAGAIPEPTVPEAWKSLDVAGLSALIADLGAKGDASKADRALLAQYLGFKYLNGAAAAKSVGIPQLTKFVQSLAGDMSEDVRSQWRAHVRAAFAADQAAVVALSEADFWKLRDLLGALGDQQVPGLILWQVSGKYLADAATIKAAGLQKCQEEATGCIYPCGAALTTEIKQQWGTKIQAAFAADEPAVAALSDADYEKVRNLVGTLGGGDLPNLIIWRMNKTLADAATVKSMGLKKCCDTVGSSIYPCGSTLTAEIKQQWGGKVRAVFAADEASVTALSEADFNQLQILLESLGGGDLPTLILWRINKSMADSTAVKSLGLQKCRIQVGGWIAACGPALTAELKQRWAATIRAAYAADQPAVAALASEDFGQLTELLSLLGDEGVPGLKSWYVAGQLADPAAVKSLGLLKCRMQVGEWVAACGPTLTAEVKQRWVTSIRAAYAADEQAVGALSDADFGQLRDLLSVLGSGDVPTLIIWRMNKTFADGATVKSQGLPKCFTEVQACIYPCGAALTVEIKKQWGAKVWAAFAANEQAVAALSDADYGNLKVLMGTLGGGDLPNLIIWRTNKNLADTATIKSQGLKKCCDDIQDCIYPCGQTLTAEIKKQWGAKIRSAFTADPAAVAALSVKEFTDLVQLLNLLGDQDTPRLVASWVPTNTAWKTGDTKVLVLLAVELAKAGGADGQAARVALAEYLTVLCTQQAAAAVAMGTEQWAGFAYNFRGDAVPAKNRTALAAALRAAFAGNPEALAKLNAKEFQFLVNALANLGDDKIDELKAQWLKVSDNWQAGDPLAALLNLPWSSDKQCLAIRCQLAKQIEDRYLGNRESIQAVDVNTWSNVIAALRGVLNPVTAARWAEKLSGAFFDEGAGTTLAAGDLATILKAVSSLGGKTPENLAQAYLAAKQDQLGDLTASELSSLVTLAAKKDRAATVALMDKAEALWLGKFNAGTMSMGDCLQICQAWRAAGSEANGKAWAVRFYGQKLGSEESRAAATQDTLHGLMRLFEVSGLWGKSDEEYPAFAETAARLAREGKLQNIGGYVAYEMWGFLVQAPKTRQILQAALKDDAGAPRLEVAKILAWAYRAREEKDTWCNLVDAGLKGCGDDDSDAKALWLTVKAYTVGVVAAFDLQHLSFAKPFLDQALAMVQAEPARLVVLRELVNYFEGLNQPLMAVELLESVKGQFSLTAVVRIEELEQWLKQADQMRLTRAAANNAVAELARKRSRLEDCQRLLARARTSGDGTSVSRLEATVQQLQQDLGG